MPIHTVVNIIRPTLTYINFTSLEVNCVLKSLQLGKLSGSDGNEISSTYDTLLSSLINDFMSRDIYMYVKIIGNAWFSLSLIKKKNS